MNTLRFSYSNTTLTTPGFWVDEVTYTLENRIATVCDGDDYRFGLKVLTEESVFNTQEKVDEIAGKGNHNTALFWVFDADRSVSKYDTRLGRSWSVDPVDQISISNYAVNYLNPIQFKDPLGNWGRESKAERKRNHFAKKYGEEKVSSVYNRNEGTDKKADYGFAVYGKNKHKYKWGENGEANAYKPYYILSTDKSFNKTKSDLGLYDAWYSSVNLSFIIAGGASFAIGRAQDKYGNTTWFATVGSGLGAESGIGLNVGKINDENGHSFIVDDLVGRGTQTSVGVGLLSYSIGGDDGDPNRLWHFYGQNYTTSDGGVSEGEGIKLITSKLIKLKVGASYQWTKTWTFGKSKR